MLVIQDKAKTDIGGVRGLYLAAVKRTSFRVWKSLFITAQYFCLELILCSTSSVDGYYFEVFRLARRSGRITSIGQTGRPFLIKRKFMDERENSLALWCRDGHLKWKWIRPLEAALGCKGRTRSVKHVGWNWCCLCGHCLTIAFKKRKGIAAGRKVQAKSTVHENLMRDLWLSESNDDSVLLRLVYSSFDELLKYVIPMQEKQTFPVSFF